jgi:RNA polymerase sigma factor (TIGR02999 family)
VPIHVVKAQKAKRTLRSIFIFFLLFGKPLGFPYSLMRKILLGRLILFDTVQKKEEGTLQPITRLIEEMSKGDSEATGRLFSEVYKELKKLAMSAMRRESPGHTLQPTALVNEAFLRLVGSENIHYENRSHFFATAAQAMRRILIDHARKKQSEKRGGGERKITLNEQILEGEQNWESLIELNQILDKLALHDKRAAQITEMKCFAGLEIEEIAGVLEISPATVKRDWQLARAWLLRELKSES